MKMKIIGIAFFAFTLLSFTYIKSKDMNTSTEKIYDIEITALSGEKIDLHDYEGKKILFVNVASKCGYTPQYADLQLLHEQYGDKVTIIGVPCNQFGFQEPGTHEEIAEFCEKNYGVTFLITEKVDVKGKDQHPLYTWLTSKEKNGKEDSEIKWNFQKYLINEKGELQAIFYSKTEPMDEELLTEINK